MTDSRLWLVPGAPLPGGRGWRVWVSRRDGQSLEVPTLTVRHRGQEQGFISRWQPLDPLPGFDRHAASLEIELSEPLPGAEYEVGFSGISAESLYWRTLPEQLRSSSVGADDGRGALTLLVASCFYRPNDREGTYVSGLIDLCRRNAVNLKLLVGDQLYQDWPPARPLTPPLKMFTDRYEAYWGDELYRRALDLTPNVFVSDDHEFWNDYPERQVQVPHTWTENLRTSYGAMGRATFDFYQGAANPDGQAFFRIEVPPLSIFVADSRHDRDSIRTDPPHFFNAKQWAALETWGRELSGPGIVVIGQPLFQVAGDWKDHSLANFAADYGRLWQVLEEVLVTHDVLVLTGDIHWGRYATTETAAGGRLHEMVASPAANIAQGPFVGSRSGAVAPTKITVPVSQGMRVWQVTTTQTDRVPTNDNNVALLRFEPGTNGRVRCRVATWRVRPVDMRWPWQPPADRGEPRLRQLFEVEFELR